MKKLTLLTGLTLTTLVLAGCKASAPTTDTTNTAAPTGATEGGSLTDKMKSWADAVKLGGGLSCTMTNTKTNTTSNYVAKGKKLHMKGFAMGDEAGANSGEIISDGTYMYSWDDVKKEGMKMALPSEEDTKNAVAKLTPPANAPQTPDFSSEDSLQKMQDAGYTVDCKPGVISDAEFVPPTDVKFSDLSAIMQDSMKKAQEGMTDDQKKQMQDALNKYGQ